jgi:chain length determinant protein (polysaccharide antigen chain regulator)
VNSLPRTSSEQDEIDLLELFQALWRRKWSIFLIALCTTLVGTLYAYFKNPVYEAQIILGPPIAADLAAFNYNLTPATPIKPISTGDAYLTFREALFAGTTLDIFQSEEKKQINSLAHKENPVYLEVRNEPLGRYSVTARSSNLSAASQSVQKFVSLAHDIALYELNKSRAHETKGVQVAIQKEIGLLHERVTVEKKNQIIRLQSALKIAESISLENAQPYRHVETDISDAAYLRGVKALKAEIQSLEQQLSNDAFNAPLYNLQYEYNKLSAMQPIKENVVLAKPYDKVQISEQHLNSKRIIIFSLFSGLMLGIFFVLLNFYKKKVKF